MSIDLQTKTAASASSKTLKRPKLREVSFEDYAQIASLASNFRLHTESHAAWTHLFSNNPAWRASQGKVPIGWVLDVDGSIAGYLGNIPLIYHLEGRTYLVATTRAWVVDTPYRSYSPLLLGTYFQQRKVDLFLSTTVNSQSEAAYSSFEGARVPVGAWDRTLFWITNYRGFTASYLRKKASSLADPLSYPLSAGLYLSDQIKQSRLPKNDGIQVLLSVAFDDRFQSFWEQLRAQKSKILIADRSRETLDWHFKFALLQNRAWIYTVEGKTGLIAYAIFLRFDFPPVGLTRMRLADFQCIAPENSLNILTAMLATAMDRCRKESIHMFELVGVTPVLEKRLESSSPHGRALGSWLSYYKANSTSLAGVLKNPEVWEPSLYDGDSSL